MADDNIPLNDMILHELRRLDENHSRVIEKFDKLDERMANQGETLVKNTAILDYHVKRTDLLQEDQRQLKAQLTHVEGEVGGLKTHMNKVNSIFEMITPTSDKLKGLAAVGTALMSLGYFVYQIKLHYFH